MNNHSVTGVIFDLYNKIGPRFNLLIFTTVVMAFTDSFRMVAAFSLFPFFGIGSHEENIEKTKFIWDVIPFQYNLESISFLVFLFFVFHALIVVLYSWLQTSYVNYYVFLWRNEIIAAVCKAKWKFFLSTPQGDINNALSQETIKLEESGRQIIQAVSNGLVGSFYILTAAFFSIKITLVLICVGGIIFVINHFLSAGIAHNSKLTVSGNSLMMRVASEFLSNIKMIKASAAGGGVRKSLKVALDKIFRHSRMAQFLPFLTRASSELMALVTVVSSLLAIKFFKIDVPSETILVVMFLFSRAYGKVANTLVSLQRVRATIGSFNFLQDLIGKLNENEEIINEDKEQFDFETLYQGIKLENITVCHEKRPVLKNVSLEIPAGKTVAFVGPSGAGKTTLVDALLCLVPVNKGKVLIDGRLLADSNLDSWRQRTAYVSQNVTMFSGSVRDNICFFTPKVGEDEMIIAAKQAQAHDFISHMVNGYDTTIGEVGMQLSGGQRQRLALTRALLSNPALLILDEATSALDSASEIKVMDTISQLHGEKTIVIVAHRLSTIKNADIIFVLDDGELVEEGTWEELRQMDGLFNSLWKMQSNETDC